MDPIIERIGQQIALGWRGKDHAEPLTADDITSAYEFAMQEVKHHRHELEKYIEFARDNLKRAWDCGELPYPIRKLAAELRGEGTVQ